MFGAIIRNAVFMLIAALVAALLSFILSFFLPLLGEPGNPVYDMFASVSNNALAAMIFAAVAAVVVRAVVESSPGGGI
jgi:hypothetical protein